MKKLYKECLVSIRKSFKKFLSITLIVLLGVGFFAGIRATSPDMKDTLNRYYQKYQMFDIELTSTYGITEDEIESIRGFGYEIEGSYSFDVVVENEDDEDAVKVLSYDENSKINQLELLEGRLPNNNMECVIERNRYTVDKKIGDTIVVLDERLYQQELEIVGIVRSPLYISSERGSTDLLTGTIHYYLYSMIDNFNSDVYTEGYVKLNDFDSYFGDDYEESVDKEEEKLEKIYADLLEKRYEDIQSTYQEGVRLGKDEYDKNYEAMKVILDNPYVDYITKESIRNQLNDAWEKIVEIQDELDRLQIPEYYVLDLNTNIGFYSYYQDTLRITNIAKVFPLVFFVVAILICLTTMTRMVEEERGQIGTLKSLGYSDEAICFKYVLYALLATVIGSLIGVAIGFLIIPKVIFNMYQMVYTLSEFRCNYYLDLTIIGMLVAITCTVGATLYTCVKCVKELPAELLRPKAPKMGKRVFLEYISFIWKRLKFSRKVTVRNVFRYKKRMLMTIIGIAGCTGLILAGFGLQDCITDLVPNQYEGVFQYQVVVTLKDNVTIQEKNDVFDKINQMDEVNQSLKVVEESIEIDGKDTKQSITLVVPLGDITDFIQLRDRKTGNRYELSSGAIVTEKLANLLELEKGDQITLKGSDDYEVVVSNITENYLYHYVYISEDIYGTNNYNTILVKTNEMNTKEESNFSNQLKELSAVSSLSFTSSTRSTFDSTMENFAYIALVLIVSAGLLAFVVLYNLASVNIGERQREMATIKVLGFYDKEVYHYISRESTILTIIGILFGLVIGRLLTAFIIKTCEVDMLMFALNIHGISYLCSVVITLVFTEIVNVVTYFALKKIDMISSLKSVE